MSEDAATPVDIPVEGGAMAKVLRNLTGNVPAGIEISLIFQDKVAA